MGVTLLRRLLWLLVVATLSGSALAQTEICGTAPAAAPRVFALEAVLSGLEQPTSLVHAGDGSGRLFVTEKSGRVRIVRAGKLTPHPFLDLRGQVATRGEQGLLSLAFHPDYLQNGRFFVSYSASRGGGSSTVIAEYRVGADPNRAVTEEKIILSLPQTGLPVHKGGQLQFGNEGYLYVSLGDGDDPDEAQQLSSLRGKILRLDVSASKLPYDIPPDNPFVNQNGRRPEIWAYGLRNPWRFSFDPCTGALFVADVGASRFEEVDLIAPGENYGWPLMEGTYCNTSLWTCLFARLVRPVFAYAHLGDDAAGGNSVIGGYVYRGSQFPDLQGRYIFADFVSPNLWALTPRPRFGLAGQVWRRQIIGQTGERLSAFGVDEAGELYALGFARGKLYRLVRATDGARAP